MTASSGIHLHGWGTSSADTLPIIGGCLIALDYKQRKFAF
jgi:hypothetical protein